MQTVRHELFGCGSVIGKESKGNSTYITVRFYESGKEMRFAIPESFESGFIEAGGDLKDEVEAAIQARNEARRIVHEALVAATPSTPRRFRTSGMSAGSAVVNSSDAATRDDYEAYLIHKGYAEVTRKGAPSTVFQYIKSVDSVLEEEHLTWSTLKPQLPGILSLYAEGGAKEALGSRQHYTVINALKRFSEFANN